MKNPCRIVSRNELAGGKLLQSSNPIFAKEYASPPGLHLGSAQAPVCDSPRPAPDTAG